MAKDLRDFRRAPRRGRLEASALVRGADMDHALVGEAKQAAIGAMAGTVVELGPGPGINLRYYAPGTRVIAIEPNPAMHRGLLAAARAHDVDVDIRTLHGERMDVEDASADAVVGTLVLCGVDDPASVVAEIMRVLRPGSTYLFYEHVRAPEGTLTRLGQRIAKRPQRWMLNGCEVDRDTQALLEHAGFSSLEVTPVDAGPAAVWTRTRILGTATR
ncbi:MAG TPA: class I SAM-dependent methyltransferase [Euzebya sp.]|nr:class I SAM-dependent methyltransferase [Euzebya sp.]